MSPLIMIHCAVGEMSVSVRLNRWMVASASSATVRLSAKVDSMNTLSVYMRNWLDISVRHVEKVTRVAPTTTIILPPTLAPNDMCVLYARHSLPSNMVWKRMFYVFTQVRLLMCNFNGLYCKHYSPARSGSLCLKIVSAVTWIILITKKIASFGICVTRSPTKRPYNGSWHYIKF